MARERDLHRGRSIDLRVGTGHHRHEPGERRAYPCPDGPDAPSAAGKVTGSTVHLEQGAGGFVRGTTVRVQDSALGALAADQVEFRDGFAFLVLARRVSGQVTVLLDWRGVAAATATLLVLGRLLRGRR